MVSVPTGCCFYVYGGRYKKLIKINAVYVGTESWREKSERGVGKGQSLASLKASLNYHIHILHVARTGSRGQSFCARAREVSSF